MSGRSPDRPHSREELDRIATAALARALADATLADPRITQAAIAAHLGQAEQRLSKQLVGESPVQLRTVLGLTGPFAAIGERVVAELARRLGKTLSDTPAPSSITDDVLALAGLGGAAGRALERLEAAVRDRVIDRHEATDVITALDALIQRAVSLRDRMQIAVRSGADGLRGAS